MKTILITISVSLLFIPILGGLVSGQLTALSVNEGITAKIRASDRQFFEGYDVFSAGTREQPDALLFDKKDKYRIPDRFWGKPLSKEEIIYAMHRLDDQYNSGEWNMPREPKAFNIFNSKGEVLGYIYTSLADILVARTKDGKVTVYLPSAESQGDAAEGGG